MDRGHVCINSLLLLRPMGLANLKGTIYAYQYCTCSTSHYCSCRPTLLWQVSNHVKRLQLELPTSLISKHFRNSTWMLTYIDIIRCKSYQLGYSISITPWYWLYKLLVLPRRWRWYYPYIIVTKNGFIKGRHAMHKFPCLSFLLWLMKIWYFIEEERSL